MSGPDGRLDEPGRTVDAEPLLRAAVDEGAIHRDNARTLEQWLDGLRDAVVGAAGYRRFLHDDVQPANVMADRGDYRALIDWGDAGWGDPALDFRTLPARAVAVALAGYRQVAPLDGDDSAEQRIWWDHLLAAVYAARRPLAPQRLEWSRPPAARLIELLALVAEGRTVGRFT